MNDQLKIAIVTGSTRPGRNNEAVARWVHSVSKDRQDAEFELVDIADYSLAPSWFWKRRRPHAK